MSAYSTIAPWNELPREVNLVIRDFPEGVGREALKETLVSAYGDGSPSEFQAVTIAFAQLFCTVTNKALDDKCAYVTATFRDDIDDETLHYHLYSYAYGWALPIRMEYQGVTYRLFATLSEGHPSVPFLKEVLWEHQEQRKRDTMALEHALRLQLAQEEAKKNNDHLSHLHALLGKKDSEVYFAKKALQKKENELTKLQNLLNLVEKDKEIGALREEAKKNNDHLSLLHALLGKKDSEVYFAKKALQKKEKELTKLQNQLNERRNQFFEWTRNTEKVSELAKKAGLLRNG